MLKQVEQFSRIEFACDRQVTCTSPSGKSVTLTPFLHTPVKFLYNKAGEEKVITDGEAKSLVRMYPDEIGIYKYDGGDFEVVKCENHGYIQVNKKDGRYFSYTDGTYFNPIGINLAFLTPYGKSDETGFSRSGYKYLGMKQYEAWFRQCSSNGVNLARIWLGHEYFSPDSEQAGEFDYAQFSKIDALLELARKYGIKLILVLEQFLYFNYEYDAQGDSYNDDCFRKFNKRLYIGNKRCENMREWMQEDIWREKWLDKVRQFAYRYSGDTAIFAIELWNENDNCQAPWEITLKWNRYMLPEVNKLFPKQLVINSFTSLDNDCSLQRYKEFAWNLSGVKTVHRYLDQGANYEICQSNPIDLVKDSIKAVSDGTMPLFVAETGAVNNCHSGPFRYYSADHRGMLFCDLVYTPVFCGAAGCGHIWHWDNRYVEAKNLYKYFKPLKLLTDGIDFADEAFTAEACEDDEIVLLLLKGKNVSLGYLRNKNDSWQNILRDMKSEKVISSKVLKLDIAGDLETVNIWENETAGITYKNGLLYIEELKYGLLLKFM